MKQLWFAMSLVAGSLFFSVNASANPASGALLQQMNLASQSLTYELSFVSINKQGVESLRYRHARQITVHSRNYYKWMDRAGKLCNAATKLAILSWSRTVHAERRLYR